MVEKYFGQLDAKLTAPADSDLLAIEDSEDTKKINYDALANAILNKLTTKTYTVAGGTNTLIAAIDALNSNLNGLVLEYKGRLETAGSTGDSTSITEGVAAHFIHIVACGAWTNSALLAVFPANGGKPRVKVIATYSNSETPDIPVTITANGNYGLTITNALSTTCPLTVYAIKKAN